jgi:hypothetical protein
MLERRYNPLHEIETSPDIRKYMENFYCIVTINDEYSSGPKLIELNSWCYKYLGNKFKDWFLITGGSTRGQGSVNCKLLIKNPKRATFFFLHYGDAIDATVKFHNIKSFQ